MSEIEVLKKYTRTWTEKDLSIIFASALNKPIRYWDEIQCPITASQMKELKDRVISRFNRSKQIEIRKELEDTK